MTPASRALAVLFASTALVFVGCGEDPAAKKPSSPPRAGKPTGSRFAGMKVSHILIARDGRREPKVTRTNEQCLELANSILSDLKAGRDFQELATKFTDDWNPRDLKPNTNCGEPGSYQGEVIDNFVPSFQDALLATPVGTVHPTPVFEPTYGYFVIKRVK